jgi:hypothetical protein
LAFGLYCLSHFETTEPARFLTLCTALEVFAPSPDVPQHIKNLIDRWVIDAKEIAKNMLQRSQVASADPTSAASPNGVDYQDYVQLASRLEWLKKQSHTGRIREHVRAILTNAGDIRANDLATETAKLYGLRGRLTHQGQMDLGSGVSRLDEIVRKTLQAALK